MRIAVLKVICAVSVILDMLEELPLSRSFRGVSVILGILIEFPLSRSSVRLVLSWVFCESFHAQVYSRR